MTISVASRPETFPRYLSSLLSKKPRDLFNAASNNASYIYVEVKKNVGIVVQRTDEYINNTLNHQPNKKEHHLAAYAAYLSTKLGAIIASAYAAYLSTKSGTIIAIAFWTALIGFSCTAAIMTSANFLLSATIAYNCFPTIINQIRNRKTDWVHKNGSDIAVEVKNRVANALETVYKEIKAGTIAQTTAEYISNNINDKQNTKEHHIVAHAVCLSAYLGAIIASVVFPPMIAVTLSIALTLANTVLLETIKYNGYRIIINQITSEKA